MTLVSTRAAASIAKMRLTRQKRFYADAGVLHRELPRHQRRSQARPPRPLLRRYDVQNNPVHGWDCYTISDPRRTHGPDIFHLHGGGYVEEIARHHWWFAARLVRDLGATVTLPIYPLAPDHDHTEILPMVEQAYLHTVDRDQPSRTVISGDSAGGALALALAQRLRASGRPQPDRLLAFSPWVDITLPDPLSEQIDPSDPVLGVAGLREAGRLYANGADPTDPQISPDYADLTGLAPLSIFVGTRDVLLPEARRLRANAENAGIAVGYTEYPGMFHNWVMLRLPEADRTMTELETVILGKPPRLTTAHDG